MIGEVWTTQYELEEVGQNVLYFRPGMRAFLQSCPGAFERVCI